MWAVLSVIAHIPSFPVFRFLVLYELALIPQWNFFAPNPPKGDFVILFRDKLSAENISNWVELRKVYKNPYFCWIWNPNKRINKASFDIVSELIALSNGLKKSSIPETEKSEMIIQSIPYLTMLNYICYTNKTPLSKERQFAVLTKLKSGYEIVFTSNFHRLY